MAASGTLNVLSSNAIRQAYLELQPQFEKASGLAVTTAWTGTNEVVRRINGGEVFDLVIMSADAFDKIADRIVPDARADLVQSGVGVAIRPGMPKPDLSSAETVKQALLAAKSIGHSSGPSGNYLQNLFAKMGIADAIKSKVRQTPPGTPVAVLMRAGEIDLGFQQVSELIHETGIEYIGPLPADIQHISRFAGAVHASASNPEGAKAWMRFLADPANAAVIRKHGLEPAQPDR
jgi:molybdate transport system substrate-binding protein